MCDMPRFMPQHLMKDLGRWDRSKLARPGGIIICTCQRGTDLTFKKGTRYGCGEELSSWYNRLVKSSGSILAS